MICELDPCTGGTKSVLVGDEAATQASTRMLLLRPQPPDKGSVSGQRGRDPYQTIGHGEQLRRRAVHGEDGGFLRGQEPTPQSEDETEVPGRMRLRRRESGLRRRRLGDIEDVEFLVPLEGGIEGGDGEVMTESQQAAAFVNNMADMVRETGWISCLGGWSVCGGLLVLDGCLSFYMYFSCFAVLFLPRASWRG